MKPWGMHPVPVQMDHQGMRSDELRKVLAEWDEESRGCKRYAALSLRLVFGLMRNQ